MALKLKVKKLHPDAVPPRYAREGDAALDLTASTNASINTGYAEYGTGLAVEIPEGHVGLLFPRSSISGTNLSLANSVGVIDSGYRGEIKFRFRIIDKFTPMYEKGDRIGQLILLPYPKVELEEAEDLSLTERGPGGYGSSGR